MTEQQIETEGRPKRSLMRRLLISPTTSAVKEMGVSVSAFAGLAKATFGALRGTLAQAREDRADAAKSPEALWDEIVLDAKVTEQSVRARYRLAYWMDVGIVGVFSAGAGLTVARFDLNLATASNLVLLNLILIFHFAQLHKMFIAREQKVVTGTQLLKLIAKSPSMFFPFPLPEPYTLRKSPAKPGKGV